LISFSPPLAKGAVPAYFIIQGVFGLFSVLAATLGSDGLTNQFVYAVETGMRCLPVISFWMTLGDLKNTSPPVMFLFVTQGVMIAGVIGLAWWRGRAYWKTVRALAAEAAHAEAKP